ncbi:DUF4244 domain-containing protein [Arthrobacter sp. B6]|uniref:DUF4244 domain-containing protein n=1 Tax=Arthrobacter sp. B6 TaxID=1570137 RepID=UPI0009EDBE61|nr:DUF4244 domain-containing protein [Arthrobacter sp. B6]
MLMNQSTAASATEHRASRAETTVEVEGGAGAQESDAAAEMNNNVVELYPGASRRRGHSRGRMRRLGSEAGMATAEYAIATLAAVGFAGLLVFILRSDEVRGFLLNLIRTALALP